MDQQRLFNQCIVEVNGAEAAGADTVFHDKVRAVLEEFTFCIIRGAIHPRVVTAALEKFHRDFDSANDVLISGRVTRRMPNFQRLDCGDFAQVNARVGRTITRFMWNDQSDFRDAFTAMKQIRDRILRRELLPTDCKGEFLYRDHHYHDLAKVLHYPVGGGFLNQHYDGYNNDGFMNIGMSVTKKGRDFQSGGLYYVTRQGDELSVDDFLDPGDIYLHDEETLHGVHAIDRTKPLDLKSVDGRISLILSAEKFINGGVAAT